MVGIIFQPLGKAQAPLIMGRETQISSGEKTLGCGCSEGTDYLCWEIQRVPQTAPSLLLLGKRWSHQRNSVALVQGGPKSHSSLQVLQMKEPSPSSGLRDEGEDEWEEQVGGTW